MFVIGWIFSLMLIFFPENVFAEYFSRSVTELQPMIGNWYDSHGNIALTIGSDYSINGCKILAVDSDCISGGGYYRVLIAEKGGPRYIELSDWGTDIRDYHGYLRVNRKILLRNTKNPRYVESIGGIYIGMSESEVLKLYGKPSKVDYDNNWAYSNIGLNISFDGGVVIRIEIYNYGDRKFDWSGLSARNSKQDFADKYGSEVSRRGNLDIGHNEIISFKNDSVILRLCTPMFAF